MDFRVKVFGVLVSLVLAVTYFLFSYAYISVFCFGGALMSIYLVWMVFGRDRSSGLVLLTLVKKTLESHISVIGKRILDEKGRRTGLIHAAHRKECRGVITWLYI
tara:strand:+ start:529 stop:843 length:315 start_codon:yes stop_codon:yes gene_type:complete